MVNALMLISLLVNQCFLTSQVSGKPDIQKCGVLSLCSQKLGMLHSKKKVLVTSQLREWTDHISESRYLLGITYSFCTKLMVVQLHVELASREVKIEIT